MKLKQKKYVKYFQALLVEVTVEFKVVIQTRVSKFMHFEGKITHSFFLQKEGLKIEIVKILPH